MLGSSSSLTETLSEKIHCVGFNQDSKIISVGHTDGYMFYKTPEILEKSTLTFEGENLDHLNLNNCLIVERLFSSSLMVLVSRHDPRILHVYHSTTKNIICDHVFQTSVLAVRLNRHRIVVAIEDYIYIYNLEDMKLIHSINTPINKEGIIDLTHNDEQTLIAYPGSNETGLVHIFDAVNLSTITSFVAHEGTLACIRFNGEGNKIATASTKGTVIRVYSVPEGQRIFEFRRGVSRCVNIYSLCFSPDSKYLVSSSNTETVHIFKLEKIQEVEKKSTPEPVGWFESFNKAVAAFMPSQIVQVSELITTERSFATAKLPGPTRKNQVSVININHQDFVITATSDGFVYCYRLSVDGGELDLVKQHRIGPDAEGGQPMKTSVGGGEVPEKMEPKMEDSADMPPIHHKSG